MRSDYTRCCINGNITFLALTIGKIKASLEKQGGIQSTHLPTCRDQAQRRLDHPMACVPRKAEMDEPLAVDGLGHPFQDGDAARVVLDQVVVGAEDGGDFALGWEGR